MKEKYLKVTRPETHREGYACYYRYPAAGLLDGELDGAEVGEVLRIEVVEMTPEEFSALGEFPGW